MSASTAEKTEAPIQRDNVELEKVTIRFAGDSGDGMQLTGTLFSDESALFGNDLATFPDYPAEIRAPQGTVAGVSSFQVQIGSIEIHTPGDEADALVCMNPAAFKSNLKRVRKGGLVVCDIDSWKASDLKKAEYDENPLETHVVEDYKIIEAPITSLTREALAEFDMDTKLKDRSKNMFALGMMFWLYSRPLEGTENFIKQKFAKKPAVVDANIKVLHAGYNFANTLEEFASTYKVEAAEAKPGLYRQMNGNQATALGMVAASVKSGRQLVLGSYPITPASDILHELSKHKNFGVKTIQCEDEIAGVCSAIGASYAGALALTTTSGPGLDLKAEAIGLALIAELPLVIIDIQRGGPSTGLPTKTEQSDLMLALYGRHGESPIPVIAASTPANCFDFAFEAARFALERMTPVILLTDGYIANGSEPWLIPDESKLPEIKTRGIEPRKESDAPYHAYLRDEKTLARTWAIPGQAGLEHRIGGLEKEDVTGNVSYDPQNHAFMTEMRNEKVERLVELVPDQELVGEDSGDLLVVGWGGTYGSLLTATHEMQARGKKVSLAQFNYIRPLPKNTLDILKSFKKIVVCELNKGQFHHYLQSKFPEIGRLEQYNKIQGLPFTVGELTQCFEELLA